MGSRARTSDKRFQPRENRRVSRGIERRKIAGRRTDLVELLINNVVMLSEAKHLWLFRVSIAAELIRDFSLRASC